MNGYFSTSGKIFNPKFEIPTVKFYSITKFGSACSKIYAIYACLFETPKKDILRPTGKHAFWCIDRRDRSRNATSKPDEESKKRKKEMNRNDKSPIFPDHPRRATPPNLLCDHGHSHIFQKGGISLYFKFH